METDKFYDGQVSKLLKYINKNGGMMREEFHYYMHHWIVNNTKKGDYVLDTGCGIGILCMMLKNNGRNPVGIDISKKSVEHCESNVKGVKFSKMDVNKLEFQSNFFDVVASNQLIEHIEEPVDAIKEMFRVLKPGGTLLVTVPIGHALDLPDNSEGHLHAFDFYEIMRMFEGFGDNFKVYWINKWRHYNFETNEPREKNVFAIKFVKEVK